MGALELTQPGRRAALLMKLQQRMGQEQLAWTLTTLSLIRCRLVRQHGT